jgi:hypothetical protein
MARQQFQQIIHLLLVMFTLLEQLSFINYLALLVKFVIQVQQQQHGQIVQVDMLAHLVQAQTLIKGVNVVTNVVQAQWTLDKLVHQLTEIILIL